MKLTAITISAALALTACAAGRYGRETGNPLLPDFRRDEVVI